jgi:hypothetical protein
MESVGPEIRRMHKENVECVYNRVLLSHRRVKSCHLEENGWNSRASW